MERKSRDGAPSRHGFFLIACLTLTAVVLVAAVWWYYQRERELLETTLQQELEAVASVKARQVANWRNERSGDGWGIGSLPNLRVARHALTHQTMSAIDRG